MNMEREVIDAVNNLATQIRLLREDLRPELKKSDSFKRKKLEQEKLLEDIKNYQPRRVNG